MIINEIKILLGETAQNYTDAQILLAFKMAKAEISGYCHRELDEELEICAEEIAVIKLNRTNSEGLASEGFSGISQSYINDYPENIKSVLNRKRMIKCY